MKVLERSADFFGLRLPCVMVVSCFFTSGAILRGSESIHELDPLKVSTATRTSRLAADAPIRTELLGREIFSVAGVRDLAGAIDYIPGARVENNCQNCGTTEVQLLGLGAGYNRLLIDGQPLFSGLASVYGLEHIPTAFIERVEVVKGGASALYGPGAVAGVINILPHEPVVSGIDAELSHESINGEPSSAGVAVLDWVDRDQRLAGTLFGERRVAEAVDLNNDGFSDLTRKDFATVGTHFWAYPGSSGRMSGHYVYTWEERRGGDRFDLRPHETQVTEQLEHRWHRGGLSWEASPGSTFFYRLSASVSQVARDSYYGGVGPEALPGTPGHNPDAYREAIKAARLLYGYTETMRYWLDSFFEYRLPEHTISWGLQLQRDEIFDEKRDDQNRSLRLDGSVAGSRGEDPLIDGSFQNPGFYFQDEWDPTARWTVVGGLRVDWHSELDGEVVSPRIAVRHTLNENWTLRASVASGFRAPEVFDEDFHVEVFEDPTRTRNAPDLREEKSWSYAAGFLWRPNLAEEGLEIDAEFFHTDIRDTFHVPDVVHIDDAGNAHKLRRNAGGSSVSGFEINSRYRFSPALSIEGGLSFVDARFDEPPEVLTGVTEARYLKSPHWSGVAQLNYANEDFVDLFLGLVYTGPMIAVHESAGRLNRDTGHFFVLDLTATRHFPLGSGANAPHLDITAGVRNLLDERQEDLTTGPTRDPNYVYGPRSPRSYFVSTRLHF